MEENKIYGFKKETKRNSLVFFFIFALAIPFCLAVFFCYYAPRHGLNLKEILLSLMFIQAFIVLVSGILYIYVRRFKIKVTNNKLEIQSLLFKREIPLSDITKYRFYSRGGMSGALLLNTEDGRHIVIDEDVEYFNELVQYFAERVPCDQFFGYAFFRKGIFFGVSFSILSYIFVFIFSPKHFMSFILSLGPFHVVPLYFLFLFWKINFTISPNDTYLKLKRPFLKDIVFSWQDIKDRGKNDLRYERRFIWDIWICTITLDNKKIVFDKLIDNGEELLKIVAEKTNTPFLSA